MKTTIAVFVALFTASANAAESSRKRTHAVHKSSAVAEDETFDPYLGMEQRKLAPYDWNPVRPLIQHGSMSMSMSAAHSMSMSMTEPNG
jgi:hypothetical protein